MKRELLLSAALIAASAGLANAQTTGTTGTSTNNGFTNFNTGVGTQVPSSGTFVNPFGAPVDPATGLANPPINGVPPFAGFTGAFDPNLLNQGAIANSMGQGVVSPGFGGFVPGFAYGSYGYGPGAYGLTPNGSLGVPPPRMPGGRVPILGLNVPATAIPRAPRARVTQSSPTAGERLSDTPNGVVSSGGGYGTNGANAAMARAYSAPRDFATVKQVENLMREDRPLHEGRVISVGATGAEISYSLNDQSRTDRFPVDEVFFFKKNGDLVSMAQDPQLVHVGSRVLIAEPRTTTPSFAVAGSRQTYTNRPRVTNASYTVTRRSTTSHKRTVKKSTRHARHKSTCSK